MQEEVEASQVNTASSFCAPDVLGCLDTMSSNFVRSVRRSDRLLRPLIAMEVSLLNYAEASPETAVEAMRSLKETCRAVDGDFTILWHNNHLITERNRAAYAAILAP